MDGEGMQDIRPQPVDQLLEPVERQIGSARGHGAVGETQQSRVERVGRRGAAVGARLRWRAVLMDGHPRGQRRTLKGPALENGEMDIKSMTGKKLDMPVGMIATVNCDAENSHSCLFFKFASE